MITDGFPLIILQFSFPKPVIYSATALTLIQNVCDILKMNVLGGNPKKNYFPSFLQKLSRAQPGPDFSSSGPSIVVVIEPELCWVSGY